MNILRSHNRKNQSRFALAAGALLASTIPGHALTFSFVATANTPNAVIADFVQAGQRWSGQFSDPVNVVINIDFTPLGTGILGQASSTLAGLSYTTFRNRLLLDQKDNADAQAVASLSNTSTYGKLVDGTLEHPGNTPFFDNNNSSNTNSVILTQANLKALGFTGFANPDASITFSSLFNFDFDPSDGITAGQFDLVSIATHEIGHALGFSSWEDVIESNLNAISENSINSASTALDMFRYTSYNGNIFRDLTIDDSGRSRYFSIDGGVTNLGDFSLGIMGDGVGSSRVDLQACKLEYSIVSPK